ncbi:hypothetical protein MJH12_11550, partial [bacterium]|nr:hypothetical protein [bacterium]
MNEIFSDHGPVSIDDWKENLSVCFELTELDYLAIISYSEGQVTNIFHLNRESDPIDLQDQSIQSFFQTQEIHF